jgi:hypothetical protein
MRCLLVLASKPQAGASAQDSTVAVAPDDTPFVVRDLDPLEGLWLDPYNPRLRAAEEGLNPTKLLEVMIKRFRVQELAESIVASGFLTFDPIVAVEEDGFASKMGTPVRYANFRRDVWNGAVEAAGLAGVKPHDLRASHASWLIDRGFRVMDVAARLGHSSAAVTTRYYAQPMAGRDQDITAMLDRPDAGHDVADLARSWHVPQQVEPIDRESRHLIDR